jgi:prevent-host-death family protein
VETLSISQFRASFSFVLEKVEKEKKKFLITKRGKPIAEIVPVKNQQEQIPLKDTVTFVGDIVSPVAEDAGKSGKRK